MTTNPPAKKRASGKQRAKPSSRLARQAITSAVALISDDDSLQYGVEIVEDADPGNLTHMVTDLVHTGLTGIPAPVRKNFWKAFSQLSTAAISIPVAKLQGVTDEIKAVTSARVKLIKTSGDLMARQLKENPSPSYAEAAEKMEALKSLRGRKNLDRTTAIAYRELKNATPPEAEPEEISDDWLNAFEREASDMSSEHMQTLFGKILAGEVRRPKSYSIRTIKLMGQLDNRAAELFRRFCSLACTLRTGDHVFDSRVLSLGKEPISNDLQSYGLSFDSLNILSEYGLIINDYNSYMSYGSTIATDGQVSAVFVFQRQFYCLLAKAPVTPELRAGFKVRGVALTRAGRELLDIVEVEPVEGYAEALKQFFDSQGFSLDVVNMKPSAV